MAGILTAGCAPSLNDPARWTPTPVLDVADFSAWTTRGAEVGRAAQRYCVSGSERSRAWMREAIALEAAPAVVVIMCRGTTPP